MKKKPELQRVLDNITEYDVEKIEALSGSHFPRWIKDELLELTKRQGKTPEDVAQEIARQMTENSIKNRKE